MAEQAIVLAPGESSAMPAGGVISVSQALQQGLINLDMLSGEQWASIKGQLKNVKDYVLYDTARLKGGGTVLPIGTKSLFTIPQGGQDTVWNDETDTYIKSAVDTNLKGTGGMLPSGTSMIIQSIQIQVFVPSAEDTTPLLGTTSIDPTPVVAAGAAPEPLDATTNISAVNQLAAFQECIQMRYTVEDREYENGPILYYPSEFGVSGFAGGAEEGIAQNGMGRARYMTRIRHLPAMTRFAGYFDSLAAITVRRSCRIRYALVGQIFTPVG